MAIASSTLVAIGLISAMLAPAGVAQADLPPLIPREALLSNPPRLDPRLAPDGEHLGYLAPSDDGVMNIWVQTLGKDDSRMVTQDTHRGIFGYEWAHDGTHLLYIQDKDGDENWHLYAADFAGGNVKDLTPYPGVAADEILLDRNHPDEVLISLNKRDPSAFDLYRIHISTGETALEVENPGDVSEWAADRDFRIRACVALDAETSDTVIRIRSLTDGSWRPLVRWPFWEAGSVLYKKIRGFTPDGKGLIVQSPMGSDLTRMVVLDAETGEELRTIAADPDHKSDVWNIGWVPQLMQDPVTNAMQAVGFDYLKPKWKVIDPSIERDFRVLDKLTSGAFAVTSRDHADQHWIVATYSDVHPVSYYLYDRKSGQADLLFESAPQLKDFTLAPTKGVTYRARDGVTIPAYLTLPVGVPAKKLPLILNPHGGPWFRDDFGFDPWVQLLANRGYAVLQPNFRGSVGYGTKFLNLSTGQWGVGGMQHDLTDGVKWAISQGIADPARVAILGGSYGGYATLAGITFTPELYACAVDIVGPSNVASLFASFPPYWKVRMLRWKLRVGDVETDDALNRRISPLFHADQIRAPLLIGHGKNDPRVKLSESEQIVATMREHKLPVTFIVYPDEGHGFARPENNLDFLGRVEEFLAKYLGGRAEPWHEVKGSTATVQ